MARVTKTVTLALPPEMDKKSAPCSRKKAEPEVNFSEKPSEDIWKSKNGKRSQGMGG